MLPWHLLQELAAGFNSLGAEYGGVVEHAACTSWQRPFTADHEAVWDPGGLVHTE
jgi:hypothetical protein